MERDVPDVTEPNVIDDNEISADGDEWAGTLIVEPHPELQTTLKVNIATNMNLEKQHSCMIKTP